MTDLSTSDCRSIRSSQV